VPVQISGIFSCWANFGTVVGSSGISSGDGEPIAPLTTVTDSSSLVGVPTHWQNDIAPTTNAIRAHTKLRLFMIPPPSTRPDRRDRILTSGLTGANVTARQSDR
jgi:hypothetical protein